MTRLLSLLSLKPSIILFQILFQCFRPLQRILNIILLYRFLRLQILLESCAIILLSIIIYQIFFVFARQCNVRYYSENLSVLDKFNIMRTLRQPNRTTTILFVTNLILLNSIPMKIRSKPVIQIIFYDFLEICFEKFQKLFAIARPLQRCTTFSSKSVICTVTVLEKKKKNMIIYYNIIYP